MAKSDPFAFNISAAADKKKRARRRGMSGAVHSSTKVCEHPDCEEAGQFRAPRSPDAVEDFYWFCKTHIREYNTRWNYFSDHSPDELEEQMSRDKLWDRPTWSMKGADGVPGASGHPEGRAWQRFGFDDPHEALGENATINKGRAPGEEGKPRRRLPPEDRRALHVMGAEDHLTKSELRKVYKGLIKELHPDMNGGKRDDEEKLTEVVTAWEHLRQSRFIPD